MRIVITILITLIGIFAVGAQEEIDGLELRATLSGHELPVNDLAFSPDGSRLASGSDDLTVVVWDVASGAPEITFEGQLHPVRSVDFSPDGETLLTTGFNGIAFLWDLRSQTRAVSVNLDEFPSMSDGAFSPDGAQFALAVGTGEVVVFDTETQEEVASYAGGETLLVERVGWNDDGSRLIAGYGFPSDSALVWEAETGDLLFSVNAGNGTAYGVDIAPDGTTTAVGSGEGSVLLWALTDEASFDLLHDLRDAHPGGVFDVAFSPDGTRLASVGFDGALRVWDVASGEMAAEAVPSEAARSLLAVAWGPEGERIAAAGETGDVYVWGMQ